MFSRSSTSLRALLNAWPGKSTFGMYRFLPAFFLTGAIVEYSMIKWTVGETNFCKYLYTVVLFHL